MVLPVGSRERKMRQSFFRIFSRLSRPWEARPTNDVVGWIDGVNRGRLHGWVCHRSYPLNRMTVDIFTAAGSRLVVLADRYRADLQQSGLSDGYCGFSVPLHRLTGSGP